MKLLKTLITIVFVSTLSLSINAKEIKIPTLSILANGDKMCPVKEGKKLADLIDGSKVEIIESITKGKLIDTTGAGDIYAGGFIHGLINNCSLKKCGEIASICAGQIITQLGSRSDIDLKELIKLI